VSNHAFLSVRGRLKAVAVIDADLRKIVARRFKGCVQVSSCDYDYGPENEPMWHVCISGHENMCSWNIWVASRRKLETRHSHGDVNSWTQAVVLNELAVLYDGLLSDEGVPDIWKGTARKYPTLGSYMKAMSFSKSAYATGILRNLKEEYRKMLPAKLVG